MDETKRRQFAVNLRHSWLLINIAILLAGCASGDIDISDRWPEFRPLKGKCFETKSLCFVWGDRIESGGDGLPSSIEEWNSLPDESFKHSYTPLNAGTKFRVLAAYDITGDSGGRRIDGIILNGPLKGQRVNLVDVFVVLHYFKLENSNMSTASYWIVAPSYIKACEPSTETSKYSLIQKLRVLETEKAIKRTPALALTAFVGEADERKALAMGFDRHLGKPVDPAELVSALLALATTS